MRLLQTVRALSLTALCLTAGLVVSSDSDTLAHYRSSLKELVKVQPTATPSAPAVRYSADNLTPPPPPPDDSADFIRKLIVRNLGRIVNSDAQDLAPTITADGSTMYFVTRRPNTSEGYGSHDFWVSTSADLSDSTWIAPRPVNDINTPSADGAASIAADGQTIFFASNRNTTEPNDINIWVATLDGRTWRNVREVGPPVNTTKFESQPSISPDGRRLYFASNREDAGTFGGVDVFVSRQMADGRWGPPVNLGSKINSKGYDGSPFVATDGTTLYFCSERSGTIGGRDFFRSEWVGPSDTDWTEPYHFPAPINSDKNEMFLTVPAAGNVLYFSSDRSGGSGEYDLYVATAPPPPKQNLVLKGRAYDINTKDNLAAHVVVLDEQTGDTVYNRTANSATGEYLVVLSPNARGELGGSYIVSATESNHFPYPPTPVRIPLRSDTSRIITHDIPMNNEEPPLVQWMTTPPALLTELPNASTRWPNFEGVIIRERETIELFALLPMVFFDEASGTLPNRYVLYTDPAQTQGFREDTLTATLNAYYNYLNVIGQRMRNNPSTSIKLTGTNSMDVAGEKSIELSRQRAASAKRYLVEIWGIAPNRISTDARNLPENATLATTVEGIEENRRVELSSDSWEIIKPVLFRQNVKVPDHRTVRFSMVNGLREEAIDRRELVISYQGKPFKVLKELGPLSAKESGEWNWRNEAGRLPEGEDQMQVQLKVIDKGGREVLSNVDEISVRQFSTRDVIAENLGDKTREVYNLILFKYNSSDMGKWNRMILDEFVFPRVTGISDVSVGGYTDILGTDEYNLKLSGNRANAVKGEMASRIKGKVKSMIATGYGETTPLYINDLPEGRYYNRTVQVLVETPINTPRP